MLTSSLSTPAPPVTLLPLPSVVIAIASAVERNEHTIEMLTIILFATLSLTAGCAIDDDSAEGDRGLRETNHTPANENFDIGVPESSDPLIEDGRVVWAEDVIRSGVRMTFVHHLDLDNGIDEVSILDESGRYMTAVTTRYPIVLDVEAPKLAAARS